MFLSLLALAALAAPSNAPPPASPSAAQEPEAAFEWFGGTFEEALGEAQRQQRHLLVLFCAGAAPFCRKLDEQTLGHPPVAELLPRFVCLRIDAGTEGGQAVGKRFHVSTLPTTLFFEPDGAVRDVIRGFVPPEPYRDELARVLSGEGTITRLRERIAKDAKDLDARYELARKLSKVGDAAGIEEQVKAIEELDPEGTSRASRRLAMDRAAQELQRMQPPTDARFRELLEGETDPDLLYLGWSWVYRIDRAIARSKQDAEERASYEAFGREAAMLAWPHCPATERSMFGNEVAWWLYQQREAIPDADKRFALEVAREVIQLQPGDANLRDTYAGCLSMNGRREEAVAQLRKAIELEPDNPEWKARLADLEGE